MPDLLNEASRGKQIKPMTRSGVSGVAVHGGYLDDAESNSDLKGQRKFKTFSELLANVAIIAASARYILNMIGRAQWTVTPNPLGGKRAEEVAELVESIRGDMERSWSKVVKRTAMYRFHGYSWQEWIAKKRDDGAIGYLDIEPRSQATITRWDVDEAGVVYGVIQESPQDYREIYLPRAQAIYTVDDAISDSPEGLGILRHAYPTAERLAVYERLEGNGFETDLRGVPIGRAPYSMISDRVKNEGLSAGDAALMTSVIESFVEDHVRGTTTGLVIDSEVYAASGESQTPSSTGLWGMDLLSSTSTGQEAAANAISRLVRSLARLFGTEGILLGEGSGGSYSLSKDKSNQAGLIVDGALGEIAEQYEKDFLGPLVAMNGWAPETVPSLTPEKLQHREVTEISETLEGLARAGAPILPDDPAVNVVREAIGLPEVETIDLDLDSSLRRRKPPEDDVDDVDDEGAEQDKTPTAGDDAVDDSE